MGSMPYRKKKTWSALGARRQNLSRLRVEELGCAGSRQVDVEVGRDLQTPYKSRGSWPPHPSVVRRAGVVPIFLSHCFAFFSSLYSPKTAFAALANLQSEDLAL
jgi:hypothetical protein